jgi:hypothetical protein
MGEGLARSVCRARRRVLQGRHIDPVRPHTTGVTGQRRYRATGLPRGLHIDTRTGVITGRAQRAGGHSVNVTVTGTNGGASTKVRIQVTADPTYHPPTPRPHNPRQDSARQTSPSLPPNPSSVVRAISLLGNEDH